MCDGHWTDDGTNFVYDYEKISNETGWSIDDIKARGVSWCRRNPKTPSDNSLNNDRA